MLWVNFVQSCLKVNFLFKIPHGMFPLTHIDSNVKDYDEAVASIHQKLEGARS